MQRSCSGRVGQRVQRRAVAGFASDFERDALPSGMGDQRVWHFGPGCHCRGLHDRNDSALGRTGPFPHQLFVREESPCSGHHVLDAKSIRALGRRPAARPVPQTAND